MGKQEKRTGLSDESNYPYPQAISPGSSASTLKTFFFDRYGLLLTGLLFVLFVLATLKA